MDAEMPSEMFTEEMHEELKPSISHCLSEDVYKEYIGRETAFMKSMKLFSIGKTLREHYDYLLSELIEIKKAEIVEIQAKMINKVADKSIDESVKNTKSLEILEASKQTSFFIMQREDKEKIVPIESMNECSRNDDDEVIDVLNSHDQATTTDASVVSSASDSAAYLISAKTQLLIKACRKFSLLVKKLPYEVISQASNHTLICDIAHSVAFGSGNILLSELKEHNQVTISHSHSQPSSKDALLTASQSSPAVLVKPDSIPQKTTRRSRRKPLTMPKSKSHGGSKTMRTRSSTEQAIPQEVVPPQGTKVANKKIERTRKEVRFSKSAEISVISTHNIDYSAAITEEDPLIKPQSQQQQQQQQTLPKNKRQQQQQTSPKNKHQQQQQTSPKNKQQQQQQQTSPKNKHHTSSQATSQPVSPQKQKQPVKRTARKSTKVRKQPKISESSSTGSTMVSTISHGNPPQSTMVSTISHGNPPLSSNSFVLGNSTIITRSQSRLNKPDSTITTTCINSPSLATQKGRRGKRKLVNDDVTLLPPPSKTRKQNEKTIQAEQQSTSKSSSLSKRKQQNNQTTNPAQSKRKASQKSLITHSQSSTVPDLTCPSPKHLERISKKTSKKTSAKVKKPANATTTSTKSVSEPCVAGVIKHNRLLAILSDSDFADSDYEDQTTRKAKLCSPTLKPLKPKKAKKSKKVNSKAQAKVNPPSEALTEHIDRDDMNSHKYSNSDDLFSDLSIESGSCSVNSEELQSFNRRETVPEFPKAISLDLPPIGTKKPNDSQSNDLASKRKSHTKKSSSDLPIDQPPSSNLAKLAISKQSIATQTSPFNDQTPTEQVIKNPVKRTQYNQSQAVIPRQSSSNKSQANEMEFVPSSVISDDQSSSRGLSSSDEDYHYSSRSTNAVKKSLLAPTSKPNAIKKLRKDIQKPVVESKDKLHEVSVLKPRDKSSLSKPPEYLAARLSMLNESRLEKSVLGSKKRLLSSSLSSSFIMANNPPSNEKQRNKGKGNSQSSWPKIDPRMINMAVPYGIKEDTY